MNPSQFSALLEETRIAFEQSDIKNCQNPPWNYSITATPIKKDRLLLIGFNWGAAEGKPYSPQTAIPQNWFMEMAGKELGSFSRVQSMLERHCPDDLEEVGQTNFCFFRSANESQITQRDLELSTPLFERFLSIAQPKAILGFSSQLRDHLIASDWLEEKEEKSIEYKSGEKNATCYVVKGTCTIDGRTIPIALLPHPNSPLRKEVREEAWRFCFG